MARRGGRTVATPPAAKAEALRLASEVGATEASRRTGIPAGSIRAWRTRERAALPASQQSDVAADIAQLTRTAQSAKRVVEAAIKRLEELLPTARGPQTLAISAGVLIDKAMQLEAAAATLQEREGERQHRIAEADAALMLVVIQARYTALGLPLTRELYAELIRAAVDLADELGFADAPSWQEQGGWYDAAASKVLAAAREADGELVASAERDVRLALERRWRAELKEELRAEMAAEAVERLDRAPLALPAPAVEREPEEPEAVSGEVVEAEPEASVEAPARVRHPSWRGAADWREQIAAQQLGRARPVPRIDRSNERR